MSKKKNTLQDLDDFLKQQAATLVTPEALKSSSASPDVSQVSAEAPTAFSPQLENDFTFSLSKDDPGFRKKLYNFIIESLEKQKDSLPEDKMLINTALYLKNGDNWKEAIRQYWKEH
jgi:hypothetical protein